MTDLHGKSLGLLLSVGPNHPSFRHATRLATAALQRGLKVYFYCLDDAVLGLTEDNLRRLKEQGLCLFACAYAAQRRNLPLDNSAAFSGLAVLSDLLANTDRFVSFH
jgi:sulfur relay (sulfurtransferase) complex TusBCD TusD component (DsrE family)